MQYTAIINVKMQMLQLVLHVTWPLACLTLLKKNTCQDAPSWGQNYKTMPTLYGNIRSRPEHSNCFLALFYYCVPYLSNNRTQLVGHCRAFLIGICSMAKIMARRNSIDGARISFESSYRFPTPPFWVCSGRASKIERLIQWYVIHIVVHNAMEIWIQSL